MFQSAKRMLTKVLFTERMLILLGATLINIIPSTMVTIIHFILKLQILRFGIIFQNNSILYDVYYIYYCTIYIIKLYLSYRSYKLDYINGDLIFLGHKKKPIPLFLLYYIFYSICKVSFNNKKKIKKKKITKITNFVIKYQTMLYKT